MTTDPAWSAHRSAWLEIDLDAVRHNARILGGLCGSAAIAPVVKANAYGHGLSAVAGALAGSVEALCVATLDEAMEVRAVAGGRVLLLYPVPAAAAPDAIASGAELSVMSPGDLAPLLASVRDGRPPVAIHLAVETGLGRGGLEPSELVPLAEAVTRDPRATLAGLWSHVATPEDPASAQLQVRRFEASVALLRSAGVAVPPRHVAASGSLFAATAPSFELVRPGLAVYGVLDPDLPVAPGAEDAAAGLRPSLSLKARAVAFVDVPPGGRVGYGGRWQAERPSRIAILPVGYADGYLRGAQPGAAALVRGVRVPLTGVVSMDAVAVDVTDIPGLGGDEEFVLLGEQASEIISAGDLARARNTIPWEVLSSMAARLDRVYYRRAGRAAEVESPAPCST